MESQAHFLFCDENDEAPNTRKKKTRSTRHCVHCGEPEKGQPTATNTCQNPACPGEEGSEIRLPHLDASFLDA